MSGGELTPSYASEERAATPDIVERIRKVAGNGYTFGTKNVVLLEAADEIERLRHERRDRSAEQHSPRHDLAAQVKTLGADSLLPDWKG